MELVLITALIVATAIWVWWPRKKERYEAWRFIEKWDRERDKSDEDPTSRREL